jgi:hypothetical protein
MDADITDVIRNIEYGDRDRIYILSQQNLLEFLFKKYGVEEETKEVTTDDKVRVAVFYSIILNCKGTFLTC